jgi:hypothetical protein
VLVIFVTVDGDDLARKVFRRAQNGIKCEGTVRKIQDVIKNLNNNIFKRYFPQENINSFF